MGRKIIDITGQRFGKLVVISFDHTGNRAATYWKCKCDCGGERIVRKDHLMDGSSTDCGCYRKHISHWNKHGMYNTRLYTIWSLMKERCYNKKRKEYPNYGGRGIKVCSEWLDSSTFIKWALSNGYSEDLTIDRIDNNGDYCPDNCRWVSKKVQQNNNRRNRLYTCNGVTKSVAQWCEETGLSRNVIVGRIEKLGWTVERALTEPVMTKYSNKKGSDT